MQLEWLDFGDNQVERVSGSVLQRLSCLTFLDLSFNVLTLTEGLEGLSESCEALYLANNMIKDIGPQLKHCRSLKVLELGANRISELQNLEHLLALRELWLGRNMIKEISVSLNTTFLSFYGILVT